MVIMVNEPLTLTTKESPAARLAQGRGFLGLTVIGGPASPVQDHTQCKAKEKPGTKQTQIICLMGIYE
jgi:hypothetical protein